MNNKKLILLFFIITILLPIFISGMDLSASVLLQVENLNRQQKPKSIKKTITKKQLQAIKANVPSKKQINAQSIEQSISLLKSELTATLITPPADITLSDLLGQSATTKTPEYQPLHDLVATDFNPEKITDEKSIKEIEQELKDITHARGALLEQSSRIDKFKSKINAPIQNIIAEEQTLITIENDMQNILPQVKELKNIVKNLENAATECYKRYQELPAINPQLLQKKDIAVALNSTINDTDAHKKPDSINGFLSNTSLSTLLSQKITQYPEEPMTTLWYDFNYDQFSRKLSLQALLLNALSQFFGLFKFWQTNKKTN